MLKLPEQFGFRRVVTMSQKIGPTLIEGRQRIDIYYYPPAGRKLRSLKDVEKYLSKQQLESSLSLRNFSFGKEIFGLGEFETVRQTNSGKKETSSKKSLPPMAAENRKKEISDSDNPDVQLVIHCEELGKETEIQAKKGKRLKKVMRKFIELAGLERFNESVFLCGGKRLKESDTVDSLLTNRIDVRLGERGN